MPPKNAVWKDRTYCLAFAVLTFFCWCPLVYGRYGEVDRILGIPSWAALALGFGAILFFLEWIYLFISRLTLSDDNLDRIVTLIQADAAA